MVFNCDFDWWTLTCGWWEKSIWKTRYINNDGILQIFRFTGIVMQDTKPPNFQNSTFLQVERFWLRPEWKVWALYSWIKGGCNIVEIQKQLSSSFFPQSGITERHVPVEIFPKKHRNFWPQRNYGNEKQLVPKNREEVQIFTFLGEFSDRSFRLF